MALTFNSLTEKVKQMLGGVQQQGARTLADIGLNLQWAGQQAKQNMPATAAFAKELYKGPQTFGKGFAETLRTSAPSVFGPSNISLQQSYAKTLQDVGQKNIQKGYQVSNRNLVNSGQKLLNRGAQEYKGAAQGARQSAINVGMGGVQSAMPVFGAQYALKNPAMVGLGGVLSGAVNKAQGGSFREGFGQGAASMVRDSALYQATNPLIAGVTGAAKTMKILKTPIQKYVAGSILSGIGNMGEDEIVSNLLQNPRGATDRVLSFGLGAVASLGGGKIENWKSLKKSTRKAIVDSADKAGYLTKSARDVWYGAPDVPAFLYDAWHQMRKLGWDGTSNINKQAGFIDLNAEIFPKMKGDVEVKQGKIPTKPPVDPLVALKNKAKKYKSAEDKIAFFEKELASGKYDAKTEYASPIEALEKSPILYLKNQIFELRKKLGNQKVTKTSRNLYHTTPRSNLESIAREGLVTGKPARFEGVSSHNKISFSANEAGAAYYGGADDVMIRTKTNFKPEDLDFDLLAGGEGTYRTGKNIPPEMLEVKINGKWQQLTDIWNQANKGVASTSQPKTPRTIKVAGQNRTQQPISSPASGSVGTVAGASGGQTSQPILETAPLNKSIPQRGFAESVQTNKKTPAEIKPELEKIRYEPISNAETMAQADKIIQTDELKALDFAKNNTDTTANSVSLKLIEKYLDQGRFSEANDLISAVAPRFTKAGQEIQILSTYGRLTPTGAIKYAQTLINQANKANPKLNLKLTEANTKIITEYANRVQSLPVGSRERIVATAQLMQKITDQVPPTIGQKIATIQTMMQLLNPKTAIRNIIGNTLFTGAENISDVFATGLDRITSIITGRRSKVLPSITAQGRGFIKGGREGFQDAMLGIDTSGGVSSQFEIKGKTFTDPIFGSLEKALNIELRVPDRAAYTAAFEGSLNNQMRAAGVAKATPEMIEIAHADGLYRTFQDNSRLAQIFSGIKKTFNKIGTPDGKFGLGDFIIKYPKTPANILSRGLDYSPAGFVKGIYEGIRPFMTGQPFNQKQFVENLSRAMVGTGLISAGYILAKNGIISGKNDKDYDISSVKRTTGQGAFKLNVSALVRFFQSGGQKQDDQNGDTLVSYDWAQPTSIQVAMGANSALGGNAEDMASIASDNLQAGVDTLTGQSMVKNLMDYAGGIKDKGFVGATQDMALNSATGFIPSVVRQTANVFDPLQRSTYAETPAGVAINKAKATIPFVRNTLEPKLDVFGKEMPNYEGGGLQRLFDIFVNPAFVTKIQENPAAKEVIDIYQRSGLTTQAPRVADSKIKINGQDVKVSPRQYTEYQRYIGTKTDETFNALMNDPLFRKSSDEEKAKLLQGILTDINSAAKIELFGNNPKSIPQDVKNIIKSSTNATDRMLTLTKEGNLKMAMGDIEYPKLTGNTELDKKLISSYQGKLTQKANEVVAMFEAGEITASQAESELSKIIELKNKASTKKAKKAPTIKVKKLSVPRVPTIKIRKFTPPKINIKRKKLTLKNKSNTMRIKV